MTLSIFYSWQSDSPSKVNRYFIRDCLQQALKKLNNENLLEEAIRLDHDTAGIPGTPDIANTIFKKIENASVFVADLTLSSAAISGKKSPNPNVLIELGYAFCAISDSRVISVINTTFGEASQLPFDLSHKRWPIQYSLSDEDAENKTKIENEKNKLISTLYDAIRLVLETASKSLATSSHQTGLPSISYIEQCILASDPQNDWEQISNNMSSVAINKNDVNLRLVINYSEEGTQCLDFREEWANRHPDPQATGYWCDIYYASTHVWRNILVSVDGGRALLPIPRQVGADEKRSEVLPFDYQLAQIFDSSGTLNEYMFRSNLRISFANLSPRKAQ